MNPNSSAASPLEALKAGFRRACVRRLVGDEQRAIEVLKNEIPLLVVGWAKTSNLEPAAKKGKLQELFDDESARADELAAAFDLFAGRFEVRVAEIVRKELQKTVSKIDGLIESMNLSSSPANGLEDRESNTTIEQSQLVEDKLEESAEDNTEPMERKNEDIGKPLSEEEVAHLDPPKGLGLKFDEIEEMIDQVLSQNLS